MHTRLEDYKKNTAIWGGFSGGYFLNVDKCGMKEDLLDANMSKKIKEWNTGFFLHKTIFLVLIKVL